MVFCHVECLNWFYFNIHLWTIFYGFDLVWMRKVEYEDGICQKTAKLAIKAMFSDFYGLSWQPNERAHVVLRTLYKLTQKRHSVARILWIISLLSAY